jgi:hypothetical protein
MLIQLGLIKEDFLIFHTLCRLYLSVQKIARTRSAPPPLPPHVPGGAHLPAPPLLAPRLHLPLHLPNNKMHLIEQENIVCVFLTRIQ